MTDSGFKEISDFPGYYINQFGVVKGKRADTLKIAVDKRGYQRVWLYCKGRRREAHVHRLVAKHFVAGDTTLTVNHIDGNKINNHATNLEWCSNADNMRHSFNSGLRDTSKTWTTRRKNNNGFWSVNSTTQKAICHDFLNESLSRVKLAEKYGIHPKTVSSVLKFYEMA